MERLDRNIYFGLQKLSTLFKSHKIESFKIMNITPLMADILKYISSHKENICTISHISNDLSVSKATLSDAVSALETRGIIKKNEDQNDARIKYISLTSQGEKIIRELSKYEDMFYRAISNINKEKKESFYTVIVDILKFFKEKGDIKTFRSCVSCQNFEPDRFKSGTKRHYCKFLKIRFKDADLNIDCDYNVPKDNDVEILK